MIYFYINKENKQTHKYLMVVSDNGDLFPLMEFCVINPRKTVKLKFIKAYFLRSDQIVE